MARSPPRMTLTNIKKPTTTKTLTTLNGKHNLDAYDSDWKKRNSKEKMTSNYDSRTMQSRLWQNYEP
jgi:hypothetical protein